MKQPTHKAKETLKGNKPKQPHSRKMLQKIMDQSLDVICTIDEKGRFIQVSKASKQVWGYEAEELINKRYIDFVLEEDQFKTNEADARIRAGVDTRNFENRYIRKNKSIVHIVWSARWDDKEKMMYAIARDASEKKEAEEKIKETEVLLQSSIESAKDINILAIDKNYKYLYFNSTHKKVMFRTYGKEIKEGINILDCIANDEDRKITKINIDRALNGESHLVEGEYGGLDRFYYEIRYNPIFNDKNEIIGTTAFASDITARKKAEEQLKKSEEKFRSVIERISDAFVALDQNWCYTYMNKRAGELFNRDPQAMIGKHIWTEFPEDIDEPFYKAYLKAMAEQKYIQLEEYYPPYDKWFVNHIYPSPDGLSIYFFDITERKKAEEKIRIHEARLLKSQEIGNLGYWELNRDSNMIWGSKKAMEIFGFSSEAGEVSVEKVEACIPDVDKIRQASADLIKRGKKYNIEFLINPADGSSAKYMSSIAELEKDIHGKTSKIMGVMQDITERKIAEQKLLKAYNEITTILESITDGFVTVDKSWKVKYWNKAAEEMLGRRRENIIDKNLWESFADTIPTRFYSEINKAMDENSPVHFEEYYPAADTWFADSVYPSKDGLSIFFQNVTERKRQERLYILEKETLQFYTAHSTSLEDMLTFLLNGIQKIHPEMLCSVLKIEDGKMYNWSSPQLPQGYNDAVEGLPIGINQGSCGTAAYLRENVEVSDISTHPYWKDYKEIAAQFGLKACWSFPIFDSRKNLLGTFGIYYSKNRSPKPEEKLTIERARNILINIIENRLAENALKAYKDQLELIYNTSTDVIFLLSIENGNRFRFTTVNLPFLSATGLKREEVEGKYAEEVIPEPSRSLVFSKYKQAIREHNTIFWEETTDYPSGRKTGIVSISPVFNEQNECIKLLGIIHDITERKKSEEEIKLSNEKLKLKNEELEEKNTKLEEIAWIQSHKIRAPLARIMGLVDLLKNHRNEQMDIDELLGYIINSSNELDVLIREIVNKTEQVNNPDNETESLDS
jgi:PAS domain S-box-containing protein